MPRHSLEVVENGLMALVVAGGNAAAAHEHMKTLGLPPVAPQTLNKWRRDNEARYNELRREHAREIEEGMVDAHREVALSAAEVALELVQLTRAQAREGKLRDPAGAARNMATVAGINVDKMLVLDGRPTVIERRVTADDTIARLVKAGVLTDVVTLPESAVQEIGEGS